MANSCTASALGPTTKVVVHTKIKRSAEKEVCERLFLRAKFKTAHGLCGGALVKGVVTLSGLTSSSEEPPSAADGAGRLPQSVDEIEPLLTPSSVSSSSFWTSLKLAEVVYAGTFVMNGK